MWRSCGPTTSQPLSTAPRAPGERHLAPDAFPDPLRPYLRDLYEVPYPAHSDGPLRIPVSAGVTPILNVTFVGRGWIEFSDGPGFWLPPVMLSGPQPDAYAATVDGEIRGFYVVFHAVGPLALLGVRRYWRGGPDAPPALATMVRPGLAEAARAYEAAVLAAPDFDTRAALTIDLFLNGLAGAPAADLAEAAFLQRAIEAIERAEGRIRVEALARRLGVSAPTLRRRFAALGVPVKRYAEVVRFRLAHAFLHAVPGTTWSDVVDRFGYADQPHFVRAYRRLAGVPPTRWASEGRLIDRRLGIEVPPPDARAKD